MEMKRKYEDKARKHLEEFNESKKKYFHSLMVKHICWSWSESMKKSTEYWMNSQNEKRQIWMKKWKKEVHKGEADKVTEI